MRLLNFNNYKTAIRAKVENDTIQFSEEESYSGSVTEKDGLYEVLNKQLIAIFSDKKKNYLYLNGILVELTSEISGEYFIAENMNTESWFKLFQRGTLIFTLNYINPYRPFVLLGPFFSDEDYNTTNFAYHLDEYIKKIHENPEIVLFTSIQ